MTDKFHQKIYRVVSEIEEELGNIERLLSELNEHQKDEPRNSFYLRAVGSIFHDFYCGVERIFERIAEELNGGIPEGENWHIQLLKDMTLQIEEVRPAVISKELVAELKGYLEFRHRFRNIYGFELEWDKMKGLKETMPGIAERFKKEIKEFIAFMKTLTEEQTG